MLLENCDSKMFELDCTLGLSVVLTYIFIIQ